MARTQGIKIENNFTRGLITENTALNFPENASTDTDNCVFDETGRVSRRGAIDLEDGYTFGTARAQAAGEAFTEFLWTQVAGLGTVSFVVQQHGSILVFYNVSDSSDVSIGGEVGTLDLSSYLASDTIYSPQDWPCQYSQGRGELLVVNKACDPVVITYDSETGTLSGAVVTIKFRDFAGIIDYPSAAYNNIEYRPSFAAITDLKTDPVGDGPRHFYNLLNQGWWQGTIASGSPDANSALGQWDTARTDFPSNADTVRAVRASETDAFDISRVTNFSQGNTPAPKGHFLLKLGDVNRSAALEDAGYTLSFSSDVDSTVSPTSFSKFGNLTNYAKAYDSTTSGTAATIAADTDVDSYTLPTVTIGSDKTASVSSTSSYYYTGLYFPSGKRVTKAVVNNSIGTSSIYWTNAPTPTVYGLVDNTNYQQKLNFTLYGSNTPPASATDGTALGSATRSSTATYSPSTTPESHSFSLGSASTTITSSDTTTPYTYVWIAVRRVISCPSNTWYYYGTRPVIHLDVGAANIHEVTITERQTLAGSGILSAPERTYERPQATAFFAGRAWYAGVDYKILANDLYFSQIILDSNQYGKCYQKNDPTSELFYDVLPDDGGVIKIPECGRIIKLFPYQNALVVLATNGVWLVRGGNGGTFTPTDFEVRKISSLGTQSPLSIVDVQGVPLWFGEDGVLQINYNPQFDSYSVDNITDATIRSFFTEIPKISRKYVKGAYDSSNTTVYWLFSSSNNQSDRFNYNRCLCYNALSKAFYPWTISSSSVVVRGILYSVDSIGSSDPKIKFSITYPDTATTEKLSYANTTDNVYVDWSSYAALTGNPSDASSYNSYFTTGYRLAGDSMKKFQNNWVMAFIETEEGSSCKVQSLFDFTNSGNSGKWSNKQEIYNDALLFRNINYRRLKLRGSGRVCQLKFSSNANAPFTIIGWSTLNTSNAGL